MTMTAERRSEASRQNGRKSRGPVTDEGKARSRQNALKHGLRAEVLPLPGEDPDAVRDRHRAWQDHYQPDTPAAQHLLNQCVRATLLADRCDAYHAAALASQIRQAEGQWENQRLDEVERLAALLPDDPANAVRLLKRSGHGCRWLIAQWERLDALLAAQGCWHPAEGDRAIQLLGRHPEPARSSFTLAADRLMNGRPETERTRFSPEAFLIHLAVLVCQPPPTSEEDVRLFGVYLRRLFDAERMPPALRPSYRVDALPEATHCREVLRGIVAEQLALLRSLEARLREEIDDPDRAEAVRRALILHDPAEARLFLRYHAESRTSFHRAYRELLRVLEDGEPTGDGADFTTDPIDTEQVAEISPNEPDAVAASPNEPSVVEPVSPNEPDAVAAVSPNEPEPAPTVSPNEPEPAPTSGPNGVSPGREAARYDGKVMTSGLDEAPATPLASELESVPLTALRRDRGER